MAGREVSTADPGRSLAGLPQALAGPPAVRPAWSVPAALRALRATLIVPALFALTYKVIGDPQMAVFAVFGSFASLVMATFGGTRRDKLIAHLGPIPARSPAPPDRDRSARAGFSPTA